MRSMSIARKFTPVDAHNLERGKINTHLPNSRKQDSLENYSGFSFAIGSMQNLKV